MQKSNTNYNDAKPLMSLHRTKLKRKTLSQNKKFLNLAYKNKANFSTLTFQKDQKRSVEKSTPQSYRSLQLNCFKKNVENVVQDGPKSINNVASKLNKKSKKKELNLGINPNWKSIQTIQGDNIQNKQTGRSSSRLARPFKSGRYSQNIVKKCKIVRSARELGYNSKYLTIQNNKKVEPKINLYEQKIGKENKQIKKKRRFLTQVSKSVESKYNANSQGSLNSKKTFGIQKSQHQKKCITEIQLKQNLNEISSIENEIRQNSYSQEEQTSILQNINELQTFLVDFSKTKKDQTKRYNDKQLISNKQNISIQNIETGPSVNLKNERSLLDSCQLKKVSFFKHQKNKRNRLREIKSNTLIMRSIDKIKHIFPKGFFFDTLVNLQ